MKLLHIHGQGAWHDNVIIIGNREALEALKDAVEKALAGKNFTEAETEVFCADGEGYAVQVGMDDSPWEGKNWTHSASPYYENYAQGGREGQLSPHDHLILIAGGKKSDLLGDFEPEDEDG